MLKSDTLFSDRPPWLKSKLKSGTLFGHRRSVAEKYAEIYTVRPPWLKSIMKSGTLFSHRRSVAEKYDEIYTYTEIRSTF